MTRVLTRVRGTVTARPSRWAPIALAAVAVALQVAYPRQDGGARDLLTVLIVVLFSGASLTHAAQQRGWRAAGAIAAVFIGGGLAVELLGVATGFPFGDYAYAEGRIGPMLGDVPLVIPLAWSMVGYPALVVARLITAGPLAGITLGAGALAAWDLFLDPQMVAEGYWTWSSSGPYLIDVIPVTNYLAWFATAWLMMAALWPLTASWEPHRYDDRVPVALYIWTWVGSVVAHVFFLDLSQSALLGGIGMGLFVGLMAIACSRDALAVEDAARVGDAAL